MIRQPIVYIQVFCNRFVVRDVLSQTQPLVHDSDELFSSSRLLVANYEAAEHCLSLLLKQLRSQRAGRMSLMLMPRPIAVIQAMERNEGGLSPVEHRILTELALGSGAHQSIVWEGAELDNEAVIALAKQKPKPKSKS